MSSRSKFSAGLCGLLALALAGTPSEAAPMLDTVRANGVVRCGVSTGFPGFSLADSQGVFRGLDVDVCRAVAAAVFGDAAKVKFVPLTAVQRFTALQSGEVDVLARNATWTYQRSAQLGLTFTGVNYYDGTAFLVAKSSPAKQARDLNGGTICAQSGTDTLVGVQDYFSRNGLKFSPVTFEHVDTMKSAFVGGRCDAMTSDSTQLMGIRSTLANAADYRLLPEIVTKEPLSPAVRGGDDQWANIVRWSFWAMVNAEELGLSADNVKAQAASSTDPGVLRLVGKSGDLGKMLGLDAVWALNVVAQVGNYGESFRRNLEPLGVERGLNRLWRDGGLMFAPPMR
ncbi:amino acid ABC transporter substrate-binding protein [Reyranella soli]|jgi:general L-amino acid transport system substrate-binding protein|uniref:Amino acid ABC transporter substrate-binding protein n=1 Tax=Reyranella soli TaxID=1230389 RepID=A0A512N2E1_9HYPH|nr:amino acid ABC transporter substrate-binding protein [Reyranella soli]GEP53147.1 amino acid ABC transporter substrate-binding protein [Reyranella soli]